MSPPALNHAQAPKPGLVRGLSLVDSVLLIVGGVIGSGIFLTAKDIARAVPTPGLFLLVWVVGGVITLLAALAFAELGSMYPEAGGHYVYLREAYGEPVAFLYGWMITLVGATGGFAAIAVAGAQYLGVLFPIVSAQRHVGTFAGHALTRADLVAIAATAIVTWVNVLGLRRGAVLQNVATWAKIGAIAAFVALGATLGKGDWSHLGAASPATAAHASLMSIGVALIAVFWAFDGWVYLSWIGGEVRDAQRALPRALVLGVALVAVIYLVTNLVYLYALPVQEIARSAQTTAATAATALFSPRVANWLAALIAVSCFGALAAGIMSGARVYYAMAVDKVFFRKMAEIHPRWRTPAFALIVQGVWTSVLTLSGRYDQLYTYTMFMMVLSYVAGVAALFVLRRTRPQVPRPYRCTGYPVVPALYILLGLAWAVNTVVAQPRETLAGIGIVALGVPVYLCWRRWQARQS